MRACNIVLVSIISLCLLSSLAPAQTPTTTSKGPFKLKTGLSSLPGMQLSLNGLDGDSSNIGCQICWTPISTYRIQVSIPAGYEFEKFVVTDGSVSIRGISPNGRLVIGTLRVGAKPGSHEIGAIAVKSTGAGDRRIRSATFQVEIDRGPSCQPSPCSTPGPQPPEFSSPPDSCEYYEIRTRGMVKFGHRTPSIRSEWPQKINLDVAIPKRKAGAFQVQENPTFTCTSGTASISRSAPRSKMVGAHHLRVDTTPPAGQRIGGGEQTCTVLFTLVKPGTRKREPKTILRKGVFRYTVRPDGYLSFPAKSRCIKRSRPQNRLAPVPRSYQ